jgi:hypothetical protein
VKFRERDSAATQAVGYGKTMMVFHMLRRKVGEQSFDAALRDFRDRHLFEEAGWSDLCQSFETRTGSSLEPWFSQWLEREGAPSLGLESARVRSKKGSYEVVGTITQTSPAYELAVPVRVVTAKDTSWTTIELQESRQEFSIASRARPLEIAVDPGFDVFRILHEEEIAPALSGILGAKQTRFVIGADVDATMREALRDVVRDWAPDSAAVLIVNETKSLETFEGGTWFLGNGPQARQAIDQWGKGAAGASGSIVIAAKDQTGNPIGVFLPESADIAVTVGRKIPHYSKYSYLSFEGAKNVGKGMWEAGDSPLRVSFDRKNRGVPRS